MMFLYFPFVYTFHTRLLSLSSKISWFTTYVAPVLIACLYFNLDYGFSFLLIFSIYAAYEIGYIVNDCELIKKEENPTIRLNSKELKYYESKKVLIFLIRILCLVFSIFLVYIYYVNLFLPLLISVFLILITYTIYNNIRNNFNLPLYSLLVYFRYFVIFILIEKSLILAFFLYLIYPFCVTLEFSTKKRFITSYFMKFRNFDRFRSIYYFLLLILVVFLYFFSNLVYVDLFIYLSFYFFIYRLLSYVFLSKLIRSEE